MARETIGQLGSVLLILTKLIYASEVNFRAAALGSRDFFFLYHLNSLKILLVPLSQVYT